ncbi:hypothetical protein VE01_01018 [Pseudogymnoascus verrucosus]|uniref:Uncharacterized protein n=1 Tax=Pseudogymnoascus verrucosus TaxID=342668 RepID=A0A1B8GY04_9PEZI|nr:uncharacterized protein VE01_01018 [Pseudogymnoascus verrucosus]OBU00723.1 hypothetical protein VE01_01018 [Pseudogymnoascus verrucosus]
MATLDTLTPSGDQSSFKALPQPPSGIVRDQTSSFQSQTPEAPDDDDEMPLPRPDSLLAMVPDRAPPRKSVLLEHVRKPSASGSSVYSTHTVGTIGDRRSWTNSPERRESASSLVWEEEEAHTKPVSDSPVLGTKQEDHFELEDILKSTQIMHSNSISSTTSSGRPELWRRRSQRSDRSVKITDLKLANSNGFTASQSLRQTEAASDAPQIPLPAVPRKAPHRPAVGLPSRPTQFINEKSMQSNAQPEQDARQYSHPTTQYSQLATGLAPYNLPAMQSQDNLEQTQPFATKQSVRKPVALRPAPPQPEKPETMGARLSNFKNKFRSTEQLNQHRDIQTPGHTPQGSLDTVSPKPTGLMGIFRGTEDESVPAPSETKGSGSAFSKIKHKLRSSDAEDNSSPDLSSPEGSGWNLSKLKNKLRNSGNADEAAASTPTRTQPTITRLPTPDYQKQDPAPAPLTPLIHSPYSPQISPDDTQSRPGSGHGSRPPSRGRQFSFSQRPKLPPTAASTSSIQTIANASIIDGKTSPVDPAQAHIHPLLRTKTSPSATDLTLPTPPLLRIKTSPSATDLNLRMVSAAPPLPQPPTIAVSSPRFSPPATRASPPATRSSPPATREPPRGRASSPKPLSPIVTGAAKTGAPGSKPLSPVTTRQPPSPSTLSPASESAYKLQVPGEISKRMTTILESSPFLQIASTDPDDEEVYPAPALAETQVRCYQAHRVMHRSRNDVYALACGVCGVKDREGRWCCAWCAVRCCEGCLDKVKGEGLAGEKVIGGGETVGRAMVSV